MGKKIAASFPPGEILRVELEARNWTQNDLAEIMGRPLRMVNQIITGKSGISPETAMQLEGALNISAETWLNLQSIYQLSKVAENKTEDVKRRAKLYSLFPIKEMIKRGWIKATDNVDELENLLKNFCCVDDLSKAKNFIFSAKQNISSYGSPVSPTNLAWLYKVRNLAKTQITTGKFNVKAAQSAIDKLSALLLSPEEIRHVPKILSDSGIRFVIVETLPNSKLDAVCFWLDDKTPVIGITTRYDRIDNFWFTLRHELEHVLRGDGKITPVIDENVGIDSDDLPEAEKIANSVAAEFCVPQDKLEKYLLRVGPYSFAERKIIAFAGVLNIHAGLVVGQLQHKTQKFHLMRKHLVPVRNFILNGSTYDGWGFVNEEI